MRPLFLNYNFQVKNKLFYGFGFLLLVTNTQAQVTNHQNGASQEKNVQPQNVSGIFKESKVLDAKWTSGTVEGVEVLKEVPFSEPAKVLYWTQLAYPLNLAEAREHCAKQKPAGMWRLPQRMDLDRVARSLGVLIKGSMPEYSDKPVYKTLVDENSTKKLPNGTISTEKTRIRMSGEKEDPNYLYLNNEGKLAAFTNFQLKSNGTQGSKLYENAKYAVMCVSKTF